MELKRLKAENYDELLNLLNLTFSNKYGREMDFLSEQPKMWVRDDEHMEKHFGIFEDGRLVAVTGLYPFTVRIGDAALKFATTGNVATHPDYEGRGYFSATFDRVMEELPKMGIDVARLGGARQRYARYGYEPAGTVYKINFGKDNRIKYFRDGGADVEFFRIEKENTDALKYVNGLSRKSKIFVERSEEYGYLDVFAAISTKHSVPYLAVRGGKPIGYISAYANKQYVGYSEWGTNVSEIRAESCSDFVDMICAYQRRVEASILFSLPPYMTEELNIFSKSAEAISVASPSHFKVMNYEKLADALMRIKEKDTMLKGEAIMEIDGYGALRFYCGDGECGCERCDAKAALTLDRLSATRVLFGHLPPYEIKAKSPLLASWLPLPLSWDTLDFV